MILKTSETTESTTRPEKNRVGVGGDGGGDGSDDSGHNDKHSPRGSGREHQWICQLVRPRLWLSMMGLMVKVSDAIGKSIKKSSKSRRIVIKVQKLQRYEKFAKAIGSEERLPKYRSSVN